MIFSRSLLRGSCIFSWTSVGHAVKKLNKNILNTAAAAGLLSLCPASLLCVFKSLFLCIWGHYSHNRRAQNWSSEKRVMKMKRGWCKGEEAGEVEGASAWKGAVKRLQGSADEMQLCLKTSVFFCFFFLANPPWLTLSPSSHERPSILSIYLFLLLWLSV